MPDATLEQIKYSIAYWVESENVLSAYSAVELAEMKYQKLGLCSLTDKKTGLLLMLMGEPPFLFIGLHEIS